METGNHWLGVRLPLSDPRHLPHGAEVWVHAGGRKQMLPVVTGDSYKAQHPVARHFGLGKVNQVDSVEVRWPNGQTTRVEKPKADQYILVKP